MSSNPAEAELRHKVDLCPAYLVNSFSKSLVFGPVVIHPDLSVSITSSIISWSMRGGENGIIH